MTRDEISAEFNAVCGTGFSASADSEKVVDALVAAHAAGVGFSPMDFLNLLQLLIPYLSENLPGLIALLKTIFGG